MERREKNLKTLGTKESAEEECPEPSRRGFLHQVAAAGLGTVALATLTGLVSARRAEAATTGLETILAYPYTIEMDTGARTVLIYPEGQPQLAKQGKLGGDTFSASVVSVPWPNLPSRFDPSKDTLYGAIWTPYKKLYNLLAFDVLEARIAPAGPYFDFLVSPAPCVTTVSFTILMHMLIVHV